MKRHKPEPTRQHPFRGVLRLAVRDLQRHYWRVLRLVWRKGWKVEITERRGGSPVAVLIPHACYEQDLQDIKQLGAALHPE